MSPESALFGRVLRPCQDCQREKVVSKLEKIDNASFDSLTADSTLSTTGARSREGTEPPSAATRSVGGYEPAWSSRAPSFAISSRQDAHAIREEVLTSMSREWAQVTVTKAEGSSANSIATVTGKVEWDCREIDDVSLRFVHLGPECIVGDVIAGPDEFREVCWRLRSINGKTDIASVEMSVGDTVVLEGPGWVLTGCRSQKLDSSNDANGSGVPPEDRPLQPAKSRFENRPPEVPLLDLTKVKNPRAGPWPPKPKKAKAQRYRLVDWSELKGAALRFREAVSSGLEFPTLKINAQCGTQCLPVHHCKDEESLPGPADAGVLKSEPFAQMTSAYKTAAGND